MPHLLDDRLRALFTLAPTAIIMADSDRRLRAVNPAFVKMFGYTEEEALTLTARDIYADKADFVKAREVVAQSADTAPGLHFHINYRRKSGQVFPARATLMRLLDPKGEVLGYAGLVVDLSDPAHELSNLIDTADNIAAERAHLSALYHQTPAMMHSIDESGRIVTVSDAWIDRLGYDRDEVIGHKSTEFLSRESQEKARTVLKEFWATGRCERVPYTMIAKSGAEVEVELSAIIETSSGNRRTLAILEDVTERNQARRDLMAMNVSLNSFASAAAHDLQAPLRHISLYTDVVKTSLAEGRFDDIEADIDIIGQCAGRLSHMVNGLLEFARAAEGELDTAPASLEDIARHVVAEMTSNAALFPATVTVDPLPTVLCDPTLMERVFANVIGNAIKYVAPDTPPVVHVSGHVTDGWCEITVTDNGIGVEPRFRERIFQPLKRLHGPEGDYQGAGIGLALCQKIMAAHRGDIRLEDNPGGGSRVIFRLPSPAFPAQKVSALA